VFGYTNPPTSGGSANAARQHDGEALVCLRQAFTLYPASETSGIEYRRIGWHTVAMDLWREQELGL
jgi:hypothetical protein